MVADHLGGVEFVVADFSSIETPEGFAGELTPLGSRPLRVVVWVESRMQPAERPPGFEEGGVAGLLQAFHHSVSDALIGVFMVGGDELRVILHAAGWGGRFHDALDSDVAGGFVFQLIGGAIGLRDVAALAEIDRLVDRAAFPEGVEVTDLDDLTDGWDRVVGWDGDIACMRQFVTVEQAQCDAAFFVAGGDDERRGFDKLDEFSKFVEYVVMECKRVSWSRPRLFR